MEPVKLATCRIPPRRADARGRSAALAIDGDGSGIPWVRFGDEMVYCCEERDWPRLTTAVARAGAPLRERAGVVDRRRLHVVVQKGRLFQREHPDVPVLVDRGRFLLVDLDALSAAALSRDEPCYSVRGLQALHPEGADGRVVFEARDRETARAAARVRDPVVQALVEQVSPATFEADLVRLVELPTRFSTSSHYTTACDFVEQQLGTLGYATSRQAITVGGRPSRNVAARRNGTGAQPRELILVTAHLDSVNGEGNASSPAPGADDDGSGSAGVIEIARALKDHAGVHDLQFVLFGGEEQGLFGSKQFVAAMPATERARVRAVVNMDMIGTLNRSAPTVLLEGAPLSQAMLDGLAAAAATYTGLSVETSLNPFNSDHVSFLEQGMPAVLTIEGADSTNDEIHTARDTIDHINFELAAEILRMNTAFVADALGRS